MSYTLWSHGRLVGHTDLDLPHVQRHVRTGFVAPTEEGKSLLADAAGVPATTYALARAAKRAANRQRTSLSEYADFQAACDRREALELELHDEAGAVLACEWIQINDIDDQSWTIDDLDDDEEPLDPELEEAIEHDAALIDSWFRRDDDTPTPEPDPRWETMRYHILVHFGKQA